MPKVYCAAIDCAFNNDGRCRAKEIELSDHSIMTMWQWRQRFNRCKTFEESQLSKDMRKVIEPLIERRMELEMDST